MKEPTYDYRHNAYLAGKWHYTIDSESVLVTKDTADGGIESVNVYHYPNYTDAENAAYRMARLQVNA